MEYDRIIITGASSGLGEAYARALAPRARELTLIARRQERLEKLAAELQSVRPGLQVRCLPCDLAQPAARAELIRTLNSLPYGRLMLINNAGLGDYGELISAEAEKITRLLQVNMFALVELTYALLPAIIEHSGDIINISSLAADVFLPDFALYAASKSFVASFTEALRLELREHGVRALAVCPGPVHTEFGSVAQRAGHDRGDMPLKQYFYTPVATVIEESLRALDAGKARCYPSAKVWISGCLLRLLPLWLMRGILSLRPRRISAQHSETA